MELELGSWGAEELELGSWGDGEQPSGEVRWRLRSEPCSALHTALHTSLYAALHGALNAALRGALHTTQNSALHSALYTAKSITNCTMQTTAVQYRPIMCGRSCISQS